MELVLHVVVISAKSKREAQQLLTLIIVELKLGKLEGDT
jgi:hypothetical protein